MPDTTLSTPNARHGPSVGWMDGQDHVWPTRVYYEDTDAGGIVYHANYLRFCERARNEMLRLAGYPHAAMVEQTGVALAVRRCEIDFRAPARLDDPLAVVTRIVDIGAATLDAEQIVCRMAGTGKNAEPETGTVLVRVTLRLAAINQNGRPVRLPLSLRQVLERVQLRQSQD